MKIAAITITFNDDYKLNEWYNHYMEYEDEIDIHVIIDNGSRQEYIQQVKKYFKNSVIIERGNNGGCTGAYNDGLNYVLSDKEVDAIILIGNDIKLPHGSVFKLYDFLYNNEYGMISPVILKKDTDLVESYGTIINSKTLAFEHKNVNVLLSSLTNEFEISDSLPGGMNMAKREFYEVVGLQDDYLFMYSDEVDMGIRAKKKGFTMAATKNIQAWHQHININDSLTRSPLSAFLWGRNEIYLAKKHCNLRIVFRAITFRMKIAIVNNIRAWMNNDKNMKKFYWFYFRGVMSGILNIKKLPL